MKTIPFDKIIAYYCEICRSFERGFDVQKINSVNSTIVSLHAIRGFRLYKSIVELSKSNHSLEGKILLRTLLNLCFNIKWILKADQENRFKRYTDYYQIHQEIGIKALIENNLSNLNLDRLQETNRLLNKRNSETRNKYKKNNKFNDKEWSGLKIACMANEVGMDWYYKIIYKDLSNLEHSNSIVGNDYFAMNKSGNIELLPFNNIEVESQVIMMATLIFSMIVEEYSKYMQIEIDLNDELFKSIQNELNENTA